MNEPTILITGSSGLVGHALSLLLQDKYQVLIPKRSELDILQVASIHKYLEIYQPKIIIHAAALVNAGKAEDERGDESGLVYLTNVVGTRNMVEAAKNFSAKSIYISTGSVFHGQTNNPGPFSETDLPVENPDQNGWYGYTKYLGEKTGPDAIVRISHPIIPRSLRIKDDYLQKMLKAYNNGALFPLFPDQFFPLTSMDDLANVIIIIINQNKTGIFHVASDDLVTPQLMFEYAFAKLNENRKPQIVTLSIDNFYFHGNSPLRYAKYSAISSLQTQQSLLIKFESWREILNKVLE